MSATRIAGRIASTARTRNILMDKVTVRVLQNDDQEPVGLPLYLICGEIRSVTCYSDTN